MNSIKYYLKRCFFPEIGILLLLSIIFGFIRGKLCFLPGILGMTAGSIQGWLTGKISKHLKNKLTSFKKRMKFLGLGVGIYLIVTIWITALLKTASSNNTPIDWILAVLDGYKGEPFIGVSRYSAQVIGGTISGPWWVFFIVLDSILFAFLFLVSYGIGEDN